ncbi:MAG: hypothetical protein IH948_04585 [Bacteroidetes bacterium]|nr:hypothetical protein [Bacteroidota bacterium]
MHRKAVSLSKQEEVVEEPISIVEPEVEPEAVVEETPEQEAPVPEVEAQVDESTETEVQVEKSVEEEIIPKEEEVKEEDAEELLEDLEEAVQNTSSSVHEKIQDQIDTEAVGDRLQQQPLESLTRGIDLNDSFVYISELFNGDKESYDNSIAHLEGLSKKEEAIDYINSSLATEHNWDAEAETTVKFINLIERRYN